jgi:hypothetical protein
VPTFVRIGIVAAALLAFGVGATATSARVAQSDLDQFMERVLARRDENWKRLQQYILDEREQFELRGPLNTPLWGQRREYTWFIRDGFFVRSPRTADGVAVSEDERRKYEAEFLARARARERVIVEGEKTPIGKPAEPATGAPPAADVGAFLSQNRRPQFIDTAYFLRFRFESGKYALVGREPIDGREVLRIEYYPTQLFAGRGRGGREGRGPNTPNERAQTTSRLFNKVAMVTIWVDAATHQIVRYTFDNLHLDFLPVAWFVRLDHLRATMTMSQPFTDVWLPRDIELNFGATTASGSFTAQYRIDYYDYREAATGSRIKSVTVP